MKKLERNGILLGLIALVIFSSPVAAAINTIGAGQTVFLGEQGLDITGTLGANNQIAWFPSTATTTSTVPEKVIDVTATKTSFFVNLPEFASRTGTWYSWAPGLTAGTAAVAFRVDDPYLSLRIFDMDANVDVTDKWLYIGDEVEFIIETNLYPIGQRTGVPGAGAPITIKFQTPDGAILTAVTNKAGVSNSLVDIPVGTSPYHTGKFWDSGNPRYPAGTYTIWAECNANSMKDNYPAAGKTTSLKGTIPIEKVNPTIVLNTRTTVPQQTTTPSTTPAVTTGPVTSVMTVPATGITPVQTPSTLTPTAPVTGTPATPQPTRSPGFGVVSVLLTAVAVGLFRSCKNR